MQKPRNLHMSRRELLIGGAATGAFIALHPFSARAAANQAHLRVMETTDLHVHVYPYDYYSDKPVDTVGLARTATHVKAIRAEATNSLLLDNGDFLQGNPMGDYIAYERGMKDGDMPPVITALNTLGVDASVVGNHEFNYGLDFLLKSLAGELAGKIVVDCVNPLGFDKQGAYQLEVPAGSAAQEAAAVLPGSRVVAAFHHVSAVLLEDESIPAVDTDVLVLGDDREATDTVGRLADIVPGMRGVYAGRLRNAGQVEALTANLISINRRYKAHAGLRVTDV